jgi:DNA-binding NtrC family response regulator
MTNDAPANILFLDDEQPVLNAMRRALRKEGFNLFFTSDPDEALRMVGEFKIDVVVSDHLMPQMTGLEFFSLASRLHPRVQRVMLTGQADVDTAIRAINEGQVHKFLTKPWDDAQLKRTLHDAARESQARKVQEQLVRAAQPIVVKPIHASIRRDPMGAIMLEDAA